MSCDHHSLHSYQLVPTTIYQQAVSSECLVKMMTMALLLPPLGSMTSIQKSILRPMCGLFNNKNVKSFIVTMSFSRIPLYVRR